VKKKDTTQSDIVSVAPATGLSKILSYRLPEEFTGKISLGTRVLVPLGKRRVTGYVVGTGAIYQGELRDVIEVLDSEPLFDADSLRFFEFISSYYFAPLGEVIRKALPAGLNIESKRRIRAKEGAVGSSDIEREIIRLSEGEAGISIEALKKKIGAKNIHYHVDRLFRSGAVDIEYEMRGARAKRGEVKIVALKDGVNIDEVAGKLSRSPKAMDILNFISEVGRTDLSTLRERFGVVKGQLERLSGIGAIGIESEFREREIATPDIEFGEVEELSRPQSDAFSKISDSIGSGRFSVHLLFGVTGSGKTEVYIRAVKEVVASGKGAIVLVPEISLTPQLMSRFLARLGDTVAILHSGLSQGERLDQWWRVKSGKAKVVLGARSAIFAPISDPKIIIVDEEHDPSYKQGDIPRYNARDIAVMLGKIRGATVVLGSATPSLESYYNAKNGRYEISILPKRVTTEGLMPVVEIVDMKEEDFVTKSITKRLSELMTEAFESKGQIILLINRRGFSNFILCPVCGHSFLCPFCSITLTFHKKSRSLLCHYCDYSSPAPDFCPKCEGSNLVLMGTGTERVEEEIIEILPTAKISRLDRDTTRRKGAMGKIISGFARLDADILLGTQMVAKGHDFPGVTLVGVINADTSLNLPDFRSAERTFSLLTQVAGRAGRGDVPSKVLIQTYNPTHPAVICASSHDYESFAEAEAEERRALSYPPFSRLALIRLSGPIRERTEEAAVKIRDEAERIKGKRNIDVSILGPSPSPLSRLKGNFRYQLLIKGKKSRQVSEMTEALLSDIGGNLRGDVKITVDIDPIDML
jgi:primosomal protein N' (replication factor Y)